MVMKMTSLALITQDLPQKVGCIMYIYYIYSALIVYARCAVGIFLTSCIYLDLELTHASVTNFLKLDTKISSGDVSSSNDNLDCKYTCVCVHVCTHTLYNYIHEGGRKVVLYFMMTAACVHYI